MLKRLKHFSILKRTEGATAIEFALVAPVLLLLIIGIIEFGLILFATSVIENAASSGARLGITGDTYGRTDQNGQPLTREEVIKDEIDDRAGALLDPARISVSCQPIGDFGSINQNRTGSYSCGGTVDNTQSCPTAGAGGTGVIYTVAYCWEIFTPLIGEFFQNGNVVIDSSLIVRNEDFGGNAQNQ